MKEKIDVAMFNNGTIDKDTIAKWLDRDLDGLLSLLFAIKHSEVIKNVVVEWLYENHVASKLEQAAKDRKKAKKDMEEGIQEGGTHAIHE